MRFKKILVIGGAGYVGSALVPKLLTEGYNVRVYDTYWYGNVFANLNNKNLQQIQGDIRDKEKVREAMQDIDVAIHLACISNDPSFDLRPSLGRSINFDAFLGVLKSAKENNIKRFIYASSSSVYGVKEEANVAEESVPEPITDYSKYKLACEEVLKEFSDNFEYVIVRPATVCGYASRLRLDLTVNILTIHALEKGIITIYGDGKQLRPNINIKDMISVYSLLLEAPSEKIARQIFNVGYENRSIKDIAHLVRSVVGDQVTLTYREEAKDNRSYHISSNKIKDTLGFVPKHSIEDAVESIIISYNKGLIQDAFNNPMYRNIDRMKELSLA